MDYLVCEIHGKIYYTNDIIRETGWEYAKETTAGAAGLIPYHVSDEPESECNPNLDIFFHGQSIRPKIKTNDKMLQTVIDSAKLFGLANNYKSLVFGQHVIICDTNIYSSDFADGSSEYDTAVFNLRITKPNSYCVTRKVEFDVDVSGHLGGVETIKDSSVTDSINTINRYYTPDLDYLSLISDIAYIHFIGSYQNDYFDILGKINLIKN